MVVGYLKVGLRRPQQALRLARCFDGNCIIPRVAAGLQLAYPVPAPGEPEGRVALKMLIELVLVKRSIRERAECLC